MTDREDDFDRTAKDSEGRKVQQELERQLRELGDTMSDSFRHGFEGRGEEIGDRVWNVGRAAVNAAGYGISEAGRAFQAGKQEYQKRAEEARSSASASGMTDWARNFFAKKPEPTAIENIRTSAKKRHSAGVAMLATGITFAVIFGITAIACFGTAGMFTSGSAAGAEIVELYVENPPADYLRAKKELKGFQKVMLAPGETKRVTMELDERSFSMFDEGRFRMIGGTYRMLIGSSVQDIRLAQTVTVQGEACTHNDRERLSDYFQKDLHGVTREQFAALYGKPISHFDDRKPGEYSLYDSLNQLAEASPIARMVRKAARPLVYSMFKGIPHDDPQVVMVLMGMENGMIDSVVCQSGGMLPMRVAEAMVLQANGHRGKALRKLIRG